MIKKLSILLIFAGSWFSMFSQTVQLNIDKRHKVEINLSTDTGSDDIPEGYYESRDTLYFVLKPKDESDISKGSYKDLSELKIEQADVSYKVDRTNAFMNDSRDITRVLLVFRAGAIDITKKFEFVLGDNRSDIMAIPEQYWPYYMEFTKYYETGKQLKEQQKYIAAFQQLKNIISESKHAFEFNKFSNYNRVYNDMVPQVVTAYQQQQQTRLDNFKKDLGEKEQITKKELNEVKIAKDSVVLVKQIFDPFYRITEPASQDLLAKHEALIEDYNEFYQNTYDAWKKSVLSVIESGFYRGENKYEVYIDLLARMLVYTDKVETITKYDSINVSLVAVPEKGVPFLKKYTDLLETMESEHWKSEFITLLQVINDEIKNNDRLLSQQHLLNLRSLITEENQPNYYIINGFNELVKGQVTAFRDNMNKAIAKCSDKQILYYLELWVFADRFKSTKADPNLIEKVNNGLELEEKGLPNDAIKQYEIAIRIGKSALPNFLIGRLKKDYSNDVFAAERYFNDAIQIYPDFALARIYHIEVQIENKQFKQALSEIEAVLNMPDLKIWYIYFLKAKILFNMENYKGALAILQTNCDPLNSNNFEQYILLGDIYLALKDCEKAKESYNSAGDIDPDNEMYSKSMENYVKSCNN